MLKKMLQFSALLSIFAAPAAGVSGDLQFTLHKKTSGGTGPTLLVVGGIQGDEPGGFNAAALLVTSYSIRGGTLWVVPNLNFPSIVQRSRGIYGDLNRKFASLHCSDPEFTTIEKIKDIILHKDVDMVLNLHDGSGFYRPSYVDSRHNPKRWGQSIIIDQESIAARPFGKLAAMAQHAAECANNHVYDPEHRYHIKNTRTAEGNTEMAKTLTYFAITNNKPAFGIESSKSFSTSLRAYYHLLLVESFMNAAGISFERGFELTADAVGREISDHLQMVLYDDRILLDMQNSRSTLSYIPLKKNSKVDFTSASPLVALVPSRGFYRVYHGNRHLTRLHPQYFDYDTSIDSIRMDIDGEGKDVPLGERVQIKNSFLVERMDGYRVNIIGFTKPGTVDEAGIPVRKSDIMRRFSIDRAGTMFRVEVYRERKFAGMVLVCFGAGLDKETTGLPQSVMQIRDNPNKTF